MPGFIEVRKHESGRVTLAQVKESNTDLLNSIGRATSEKIMSIREIDNGNLMPTVGRQVYLSDIEFQGLKTTGLLRGTDKIKKLYGYEIIADEDLK